MVCWKLICRWFFLAAHLYFWRFFFPFQLFLGIFLTKTSQKIGEKSQPNVDFTPTWTAPRWGLCHHLPLRSAVQWQVRGWWGNGTHGLAGAQNHRFTLWFPHGKPWKTMENLWKTMENHGKPMVSPVKSSVVDVHWFSISIWKFTLRMASNLSHFITM